MNLINPKEAKHEWERPRDCNKQYLECIYMRRRSVGDEIMHYCSFTDTMCLRNSSNVKCTVYESRLEDTEDE